MIITALCFMLAFLCSCQTVGKFDYYSQKENYISATGTILSIRDNEDSKALYIELSNLTPRLEDTCFKIVGESRKIVQAKNIDSKLKAGEQITFITAPKYFGDGYVMPIVALSVNGEILLEFEEGYENLLSWLL